MRCRPHRLDAHDNIVHITTDRGETNFLFTVTSEPTVPETGGGWYLAIAGGITGRDSD